MSAVETQKKVQKIYKNLEYFMEEKMERQK